VWLANATVLRWSPPPTLQQWSAFAIKSPENTELKEKLSKQALQLHQTLFNPERLQEIFVSEIEKLIRTRVRASPKPCHNVILSEAKNLGLVLIPQRK
jgi:hypothetical protein